MLPAVARPCLPPVPEQRLSPRGPLLPPVPHLLASHPALLPCRPAAWPAQVHRRGGGHGAPVAAGRRGTAAAGHLPGCAARGGWGRLPSLLLLRLAQLAQSPAVPVAPRATHPCLRPMPHAMMQTRWGATRRPTTSTSRLRATPRPASPKRPSGGGAGGARRAGVGTAVWALRQGAARCLPPALPAHSQPGPPRPTCTRPQHAVWLEGG